MAPVPWVTTPADLIEQIVAVLLSRRHPQAIRVRASQGDGGLDVLVPAATPGYVDNYQVKRFAAGLSDSQKAQIRESLKAARDTHNDPANQILIETWYLTLPLDPSQGEMDWLVKASARLKVPFKVEWRPLSFLEGLVTDYPEVIDYYLHDGRDRLEAFISDVRDLARLPVSETGSAVQPGDMTERLGTLLLALNRHDPHYRYEFEVTAEQPILFDRPYLIASVTESSPGWFVTFHVYARYDSAPEDRPIQSSFAVSGTDLTEETADALNVMLRYGTPVDLPAATIRNLTIDMPGGLGVTGGTGDVQLGAARRVGDTPSRVVWAILPPDSLEAVTQLIFQMDAPTHGTLGGMIVRGTDTTGVVAANITIDPPSDEHPTIRLSVTLIDPQGKPVRQALPGLRFLREFHPPNRLAFGPEYGPLTLADSLPLPDSPQIIPALVLQYAEALEIVSQRSNQLILLPDFSTLTVDDYAAVIGTASILRGEEAYGTWGPIAAHPMPDQIDSSLTRTAGPIVTEQPLIVSVAGIDYDLGKAHTYLPSARIEGDITAEPGPNGTIDVTIVPGENNYAVRSLRKLTITEVQAFINDRNSAT